MTNHRLITVGQVADMLSISVRQVWRLIADGSLPRPVKIGKVSRLLLSDVEIFVEELKLQRE